MLGQQPPDIFEMFILSSVDTEVNMITKNKDLKKKYTAAICSRVVMFTHTSPAFHFGRPVVPDVQSFSATWSYPRRFSPLEQLY